VIGSPRVVWRERVRSAIFRATRAETKALRRPMPGPSSRPPKKLRKRYVNDQYPLVILKFEDGHQIKVPKGDGKSFDAWAGERVKIIAMHDPSHPDRDVLETRRADDFADEI
jgi:hypothetical protein